MSELLTYVYEFIVYNVILKTNIKEFSNLQDLSLGLDIKTIQLSVYCKEKKTSN